MKAASRAALALLAPLLLARGANAEPGLWQRAVDPQAASRSKARLRAEQLFDQVTEARRDPELLRNLSLGSAALLELAGGAERDPWQSVLLGRLLLEADAGRAPEAMQLIERGLAGLPDSEFKRQSWFDLGIAALRRGDRPRADRALSAALALAWDPDDRSITLRNRGRTRLLSGRMMAALADFRAAVELARSSLTLALGRFGLGMALERSGDYPHAMEEIGRAVAIRLPVPPYPSDSVLDFPQLIWTPAYDVHYVRALAAMSQAETSGDALEQQAHYQAALDSWQQYLDSAEELQEPFATNARRHQRRCQLALSRLGRVKPTGASGRVR